VKQLVFVGDNAKMFHVKHFI